MDPARSLAAASVALAPCVAAWHAPSRPSLAALSLSAWAVAAGAGFAALPAAPREDGSAHGGALRALAVLAPCVALSAALDVRAGRPAVAVASVALAGLAGLALLAAAGARFAARGRTALHLALALALLFAAPALEWALELGGAAAAPGWLRTASALSPIGFAWRQIASDAPASTPQGAVASLAGALLLWLASRLPRAETQR